MEIFSIIPSYRFSPENQCHLADLAKNTKVGSIMHAQGTLYRAAAVRDALGTSAEPGAVWVRSGRIVASGSPREVGIPSGVKIVELPEALILPAFVNAHAHLNLTDLGPQACPGGFADWLSGVIRKAPILPDRVAGSVERGLCLSWGSGVDYLCDIAPGPAAVDARRGGGGVSGASCLECFGIGSRQDQAIAQLKTQLEGLRVKQSPRLRLGTQPHAPYSAGLGVYEAACELSARHGYLLSTHLAETPEEEQFVREGRGPLADLLRGLGKWDDAIKPTGLHPVEWLEPVLRRGRWLLAHCNYISDSHIKTLADCGASVAYCPVASDYFGHHQPRLGVYHRYREMLAGGVNVCLGTDSILCQNPDDPQPMGVVSQMRHLYRRDRADPQMLLAMGTVNGLRALGLPESWASLRPGSPAGLVTVGIDPKDTADPWIQVLESDQPVERLEPAGFAVC